MTERRLVLVDANVLLNLAFLDRLDLFGSLSELDFRSPPEALAEVRTEKARVNDALRLGYLQEMAFSDVTELKLFTELIRIMGMGEAACLSLAVHRGALLASDEKRVFLREAQARLGPGRILNTPGLLLLGIQRKILIVDEADEMKRTLESRRFQMKFQSFRELL